jgi:hypothetical protein
LSITYPVINATYSKKGRRTQLKEKNSWEQDDYVMEQGWATMPFEKETDHLVAEKCTSFILNNNQ